MYHNQTYKYIQIFFKSIYWRPQTQITALSVGLLHVSLRALLNPIWYVRSLLNMKFKVFYYHNFLLVFRTLKSEGKNLNKCVKELSQSKT